MSPKKKLESPARGVVFAQDRSRETLRRIVDAAGEVFAEKGYDKATVAEIISRAGIGHGTFWLYFRNKEDLLRFMLQDMIDEFESFDWYREDDQEGPSVRSVEEVENIIRGVMGIFARYSDIHPLIVRASLESEDFRAALEEFNQPFVRIVEKKLCEHLEKGWCRDLDPEITAQIFVTMLEYTNLQWVSKGLPADREDLIHNLSVIFYHTLNHT
ncbi:MAG: TetR/AcrR family transcriptional regulator [Actinobacteria bacterium]|jgi:AcrR family transcriptional regulator|nr:MAG: TetR/AcrR family transcriptional regulator [Actinomycetota bacterium]